MQPLRKALAINSQRVKQVCRSLPTTLVHISKNRANRSLADNELIVASVNPLFDHYMHNAGWGRGTQDNQGFRNLSPLFQT